MNEQYSITFRNAVSNWLCDLYCIDIRYIALLIGDHLRIMSASITMSPLPTERPIDFNVNVEQFWAGQCQLNRLALAEVLQVIDDARVGKIRIHGQDLVLENARGLDYYSEMGARDRWYAELHLRVAGEQATSANNIDFGVLDTLLRGSELPFDGVTDISNWLGLVRPDEFNRSPAIEIRVAPPVDLIFDESALSSNDLQITLHARPEFDTTKIMLGIRVIPGVGLDSRREISSEIVWSPVNANRQVGKTRVKLEHADSVLVMLTLGRTTVRRQWFADPVKARNIRLVAVQQFDRDLRMIKSAVLDPQDSARFEMGIAGLLFLLGFSATVQVETDSPDLIVMTPGGRLVLVECTLRTADINMKIGKLVDRRNALRKTLDASSHRLEVYGVLVCANARDQIAVRDAELAEHSVHLITKLDLINAFDQLRFSNDPDKLMDLLDQKLSPDPFP